MHSLIGNNLACLIAKKPSRGTPKSLHKGVKWLRDEKRPVFSRIKFPLNVGEPDFPLYVIAEQRFARTIAFVVLVLILSIVATNGVSAELRALDQRLAKAILSSDIEAVKKNLGDGADTSIEIVAGDGLSFNLTDLAVVIGNPAVVRETLKTKKMSQVELFGLLPCIQGNYSVFREIYAAYDSQVHACLKSIFKPLSGRIFASRVTTFVIEAAERALGLRDSEKQKHDRFLEILSLLAGSDFRLSTVSYVAEDNTIKTINSGPTIFEETAGKYRFLDRLLSDWPQLVERFQDQEPDFDILRSVAAHGQLPMVQRLLATERFRGELKAFLPDLFVGYAKIGRSDLLKQTYADGHDTDTPDKLGEFALAAAAQFGHGDAVAALLALGADPKKYGKQQPEAILSAIKNGAEPIIESLIQAGADPKKSPDGKRWPLREAVMNGNASIVRKLVALGANPNARDADGSWAGSEVGRSSGPLGFEFSEPTAGQLSAVKALFELGYMDNPGLPSAIALVAHAKSNKAAGYLNLLKKWGAKVDPQVATRAVKRARSYFEDPGRRESFLNDYQFAQLLLDLGVDFSFRPTAIHELVESAIEISPTWLQTIIADALPYIKEGKETIIRTAASQKQEDSLAILFRSGLVPETQVDWSNVARESLISSSSRTFETLIQAYQKRHRFRFPRINGKGIVGYFFFELSAADHEFFFPNVRENLLVLARAGYKLADTNDRGESVGQAAQDRLRTMDVLHSARVDGVNAGLNVLCRRLDQNQLSAQALGYSMPRFTAWLANLVEKCKLRSRYANFVVDWSVSASILPLFAAISKGNLKDAAVAIRDGADVNKPNSAGLTPLNLSLWLDRAEIVELLLRKGAKISFQPTKAWPVPDISYANRNLIKGGAYPEIFRRHILTSRELIHPRTRDNPSHSQERRRRFLSDSRSLFDFAWYISTAREGTFYGTDNDYREPAQRISIGNRNWRSWSVSASRDKTKIISQIHEREGRGGTLLNNFCRYKGDRLMDCLRYTYYHSFRGKIPGCSLDDAPCLPRVEISFAGNSPDVIEVMQDSTSFAPQIGKDSVVLDRTRGDIHIRSAVSTRRIGPRFMFRFEIGVGGPGNNHSLETDLGAILSKIPGYLELLQQEPRYRQNNAAVGELAWRMPVYGELFYLRQEWQRLQDLLKGPDSLSEEQVTAIEIEIKNLETARELISTQLIAQGAFNPRLLVQEIKKNVRELNLQTKELVELRKYLNYRDAYVASDFDSAIRQIDRELQDHTLSAEQRQRLQNLKIHLEKTRRAEQGAEKQLSKFLEKVFGATNRLIQNLQGSLMEAALFMTSKEIADKVGMDLSSKNDLKCRVSPFEVVISDEMFEGTGADVRSAVGLPSSTDPLGGAPCAN